MSEIDKYLCGILLVLVVGLIGLATAVAIGHVIEATSFGFKEVLNVIGILSSGIIGVLAGRHTKPVAGENKDGIQ